MKGHPTAVPSSAMPMCAEKALSVSAQPLAGSAARGPPDPVAREIE